MFASLVSLALRAAALSFLCLGVAGAADKLTVSIGSLQSAIPVELLGEVRSVSGETREAFLFRVGSLLQAYTQRSAFEGCGLVWEAPTSDAWVVPMTTNGGHAGCVITRAPVPGFRATAETIHSHLGVGQETYRVNAVDRALLLGRVRLHDVIRSDGRTFSPADLGGGPGYVVAGGHLLHQDGTGAGSIRDVGPIPLAEGATAP